MHPGIGDCALLGDTQTALVSHVGLIDWMGSGGLTKLFETYLINVSTTLLMEGITSIDSV